MEEEPFKGRKRRERYKAKAQYLKGEGNSISFPSLYRKAQMKRNNPNRNQCGANASRSFEQWGHSSKRINGVDRVIEHRKSSGERKGRIEASDGLGFESKPHSSAHLVFSVEFICCLFFLFVMGGEAEKLHRKTK